MGISKKAYQDLTQRLSVADKMFKEKVEKNLKKHREYLRGHQWGGNDQQNFKYHTVDNIIFSNISAIRPSINLFNPKIFVRPRTRIRRTDNGVINTIEAAKYVQLLANYDYRELQVKRQMDMALTDALIGPWGIMQIGYTLSTEKFDSSGKQIEKHELIREDSLFAVRRSPMDLRVDPEATDHLLNDARWIALKWVKTLDEVKNNPKYSNTRNIKTNFRVPINELAGVTPSKMGDEMLDSGRDGDVWDRVEGWDLWDRTNHRLVSIIKDMDKPIQDTDWPLDYEGWPIEILYFNENPDSLFPISDIDIYIDSQDEINRIISFQMDYIQRLSRQNYAAREESIQPEEVDKMTHGPNGSIIWTQGDPNTAILPLRDTPISQDIYIIANQRKDAIREQSGVNSFEKGVGSNAETATESGLIAQGTKTRRSDREAMFRNYVMRVAKKMLHVRQQTLKDDMEIGLNPQEFAEAQKFQLGNLQKIVPPEGDPILLPWISVGEKDIQGDFDFEIEVNSTSIRNEDRDKQEALMLAQLALQVPFVNPMPAIDNVLEKFGIPNIADWRRDPQQVAQEQQAAQAIEFQKEMALDAQKRQVDLEKTKMKVAQGERKSERDFQLGISNLVKDVLIKD